MTDFDDFLAPLDPPLVIVTTAFDGERSGCIVGFHSQTSIDPVRYSVRISTANHTYGLATRAERFAVHLVNKSHGALAELFAGTTGDDIDKFERCAWTPGPDGVPLLDDLPRRFVGRRVSLVDDGGDHVEVTLEPELVEAPRAANAPDSSPFVLLRASALADLEPGHAADEDR